MSQEKIEKESHRASVSPIMLLKNNDFRCGSRTLNNVHSRIARIDKRAKSVRDEYLRMEGFSIAPFNPLPENTLCNTIQAMKHSRRCFDYTRLLSEIKNAFARRIRYPRAPHFGRYLCTT